ncbi:tryptophan synthase subunit beta, partial [Streptococcus mutans]|nr:tryptophan synthase subunit beta [Streptococcus mutans]
MSTVQTKGYYGQFGGSFVPKDLQKVLDILDENFQKYKNDADFNKELN